MPCQLFDRAFFLFATRTPIYTPAFFSNNWISAPTISCFGLGLPITKTLIEGQGGEIILESEVWKGSTVILRFHVAV